MEKKLFFIEGYGCSLNKADTEQITAYLEASGLKEAKKPESAGIIILNTCAVKEPTENKMLARAAALWKTALKKKAKLVVFGCLPKINSAGIFGISEKIVQCGPNLEELSKALGIKEHEFSPSLKQKRSNKFVSIIPIARGCTGNCSFCATKFARGSLRSYPIEAIKQKFELETEKPCEVWLTAQDCGCYGFDAGTSLPALLKALLKSRNKFRIRIGMMNPHHALKIAGELLPLFSDKRLYRFFHIPLQSGSDKILKKMNRPYSRKQFFSLVKKIRKALPDAAISTDIIVGFPSETERDFEETIKAVKSLKPDIVNISRFGARPGTPAARMRLQLDGREKKKRSRILSGLQKKIALKKNISLIGTKQEIFVSERGKKGNFVGRAVSYKPVVIEKDLLGKFVKITVSGAFSGFVFGKLLED
ncbi:MAG: tRNA (N(6)-L-threonylcarbamoyladenosine(37)-C(2))-methylthiotransferase [Candidatus ainarchaeum sp.]|nr:tRNA (N(6)-L-threonylcarbamoyladenosine(37)-C(2))-methylthiotransferase [Candidatus ainarchaeum sp.]